MIQVKHIKKVTVLFLLLITAIALVACTKKDNVPYGKLTDTNYATVGEISITEKDLYNNLRRQSANALNELIEVKLFEGYLKGAIDLLAITDAEENSTAKWAQDALDEMVNQAIFQTSIIENIEKINEDDRNLLVEKFVDSLYLANKTVNINNAVAEIKDFVKAENIENETFANGYAKSELLKGEFIIELQKRLYAREVLTSAQDDTKNDDFIKENQVVSHYKTNEKGRSDANVFYFNFISSNEANAAFREFNVKSNSYGDWFFIPNIRTVDGLVGKDTEYIEGKLKDLNIPVTNLNEDPANPGKTKITADQYRRFHDSYTPNTTRDDKLSKLEVLNLFVDMYNLVNDSALAVSATSTDELFELETAAGVAFDGTKTYEELQKVNSSLATYIYSTLNEEKPYSTLRSVGTHRYLVFQLEPNKAEIDYVSKDLDDDKNEKFVTVEELKELYILNDDSSKDEIKVQDNLHKALVQLGFVTNPAVNNDLANVDWTKVENELKTNIELWETKVFNSKLTSTYTNGKVTTLIKDNAKIEIYDGIIRAIYNQSATLEAKGSNKEGDVIASFTIKVKDNDKFNDFTITVEDLYTLLEGSIGVTATIDEIVNKLLIQEYNKKDGMFSKLTKEQLDPSEFNKDYKTLIKNFSADQFAQAGYPSSMGRESFLLLMFGTTDKAEAIEKGFLIPQLRTLYTSGFDIVRDTEFDIYQFLADYSAKQHDEFAGIKVSHLLVYYDQDGDGTPEDPEEFLSTLTEAERAEHIELIADLFETVKIALGTNVTIATELNAIVTEYQEATRIPLGFSVKEDEKAEKWMEFRKAGLNLKFENIPSEITNTSNFPSNQSTLDKVFYDRAIQLHDRIKTLIDASDDSEELINGGIPFFDMAGSTVNDGGLTEINENENLLLLLDNKQVLNGSSEYGLRSTFGYHFLLVDSISEKTSAKFDEAKDNNKDYQFTEGEVVFSAYNDKDQISASQIEYYVKGNKLEEGILMPSAVKSAFTKYYEPVLALYNNQFTKSALFFDYIGDVKFTNASNNEVLVVLKGINTKQFNGYITNNANYDALYQDWFKDLKVA